MRKARLLAASLLALGALCLAPAEDRVERFEDPKGSRELEYRDDVLAEERSFDPQGALVEERIFNASALPVETRSYLRAGGRLVRIEAKDALGGEAGSRDYHYDRNGRLLGVTATGSLGSGSAGLISSGAVPQGSWSRGAITTVLGYDESGRATLIQTIKDGLPLALERRVYGEGGALVSVQSEDKVTGLFSELVYDEKGRKSQRRDTSAKGPQLSTGYRYDESDRLVEELAYQSGRRSSKTIAYAESGSVSREETRINGILVLAVDYVENGRVEELYDDGVLFVKATYAGGRKVRDEFFIDGELIRSREYE